MHLPIKVKSPNNISKWQMRFNSAFKGLMRLSCFGYAWDYVAQDHHKTLSRKSLLADSELPNFQEN
jgi:hypothetical protein